MSSLIKLQQRLRDLSTRLTQTHDPDEQDAIQDEIYDIECQMEEELNAHDDTGGFQ